MTPCVRLSTRAAWRHHPKQVMRPGRNDAPAMVAGTTDADMPASLWRAASLGTVIS